LSTDDHHLTVQRQDRGIEGPRRQMHGLHRPSDKACGSFGRDWSPFDDADATVAAERSFTIEADHPRCKRIAVSSPVCVAPRADLVGVWKGNATGEGDVIEPLIPQCQRAHESPTWVYPRNVQRWIVRPDFENKGPSAVGGDIDVARLYQRSPQLQRLEVRIVDPSRERSSSQCRALCDVPAPLDIEQRDPRPRRMVGNPGIAWKTPATNRPQQPSETLGNEDTPSVIVKVVVVSVVPEPRDVPNAGIDRHFHEHPVQLQNRTLPNVPHGSSPCVVGPSVRSQLGALTNTQLSTSGRGSGGVVKLPAPAVAAPQPSSPVSSQKAPSHVLAFAERRTAPPPHLKRRTADAHGEDCTSNPLTRGHPKVVLDVTDRETHIRVCEALEQRPLRRLRHVRHRVPQRRRPHADQGHCLAAGHSAAVLGADLPGLEAGGVGHQQAGAAGGYALAQPAADIRVGDIVRALEGPTQMRRTATSWWAGTR
jgi:hypothetical protein